MTRVIAFLTLLFEKFPSNLRTCLCTSSSAVERSAYTGLVGGSIPSSCTNFSQVPVTIPLMAL